uniref:GPS domain-containing protein n=1 Tax=Hanusia phi TaxID=3032 RepID=A0A7S0E8W5_9CRYP
MASGQTTVSVKQISSGSMKGFIREASTTFTYYKPSPVVKLVRFCRTCNAGSMCIVNSVCGNGKSPQAGFVTWSDLQQPSNDNIVEVALENVDDWISVSIAEDGTLVGTAGFVVTFGADEGVADVGNRLSSVTVVNGRSAILRTRIPVIQGIGSLDCTVSLRTSGSSMLSWTVAFQMQVVDDRRELRCISGSCVAPVTSPSPLTASIKNVPLTSKSAAQDQLVVKLGSQTADFAVVSCNASVIIISVIPPEYTCSACTVSGGSSTVMFQASMRSDPSIAASTDFVYWASPKVTRANFDATGAFITVTLDQATDGRALHPASASSCDSFVESEAGLLGQTAPRCVWTSDQSFNIFLSPGATVLPSSVITVRGLRSKNQVSTPMLALVRVDKPLLPVYPSVQISAPQEVDPCSPLTVRALSKSARQLSYSWRCLNDDGLNAFLTNLLPSTSVVQFEAGVPEMATAGKTYTIGVTVKDFLGFSSKEAVTSITKKAFPSPTVVFTPQSPFSTFVDQDITITATAVFSSCPVAKNDMVFQWSQSSGVAVSTSYVPSSTSQLWIPRYELQAGETYAFEVSVSLQGDSSISTTASFSLAIGNLPLMAVIAGGDLIQMSEASELRLDASGSRDFDVKKGEDQGLTYQWSCYFSDGTFTRPCVDKNEQLLELPSGVQLVVPGDSLADTGELFYTFSLVVSKEGKTPSTASKQVQVTKAFVPAVVMTSNVPTYDGAVGIANQGDKLVYEASCPYPSASYVWTISPSPNVGYDVASVFPFGHNGPILLVENGVAALTQGLTYSVAVECSVNGSVGTSLSSFMVNTPPQGGTCYACLVTSSGGCVKEGRPLLDEFVVTCENWIDPDTPLTYEFGFSYVQDGETITKWFQPTTLPYLVMRLPSSTAIQLSAVVSDGRGALTSVIQDTVKTMTTGRRLLQAGSDWSSVTQDMSEKAQTQNVAGLNQLVTSVALELVAQLSANVTDLSHPRTLVMYMLSLLKPTYRSYPATTDFMSDALSTFASVGSELRLQSNASVSEIVEEVDGLLQRYAGETVEEIMLHVLNIYGVAMQWMATGSYTDAAILDRMTSNTAAVAEGFSGSLATGQSVQYVQQYSSHRLATDYAGNVVGAKSVLDLPPGLTDKYQAKNASFRYSSDQTSVTGRVSVGAHLYGAVSGRVNGTAPLTPLIGVSMHAGSPISEVSIVMPVSRTAVATAQQSVLVARCVRWRNGGFEERGCSLEGIDMTAGTVTCRCSVGVPAAQRRLTQQPATFQDVTVIAIGEFQTYDCESISNNCTAGQYLSGCGNGSKGECMSCYTCAASEYMLTDCSSFSNRRCASCSELYCSGGYRRSQCGGGGRGSCVECSKCGAGQRELVSCGETSASQDAVCIDSTGSSGDGRTQLVLSGAVRVGSSIDDEPSRGKFIAGVATAAGVGSNNVNITYVREAQGGRRALARRSDVGYQVFLQLSVDWKSVQANLGSEKLLDSLRGQGLQDVQILEYPTVAVIYLTFSSSPSIMVAPPTSTVEPSAKFNFVTSAGFVIVVSLCSFVTLVAVFVFRRYRSSRKNLQVASAVFEPHAEVYERPPENEEAGPHSFDHSDIEGSVTEESESDGHSQEAEMRDVLCYADIGHFNEASSNSSAESQFVLASHVQEDSDEVVASYLT